MWVLLLTAVKLKNWIFLKFCGLPRFLLFLTTCWLDVHKPVHFLAGPKRNNGLGVSRSIRSHSYTIMQTVAKSDCCIFSRSESWPTGSSLYALDLSPLCVTQIMWCVGSCDQFWAELNFKGKKLSTFIFYLIINLLYLEQMDILINVFVQLADVFRLLFKIQSLRR